jgi:hypothetical protein
MCPEVGTTIQLAFASIYELVLETARGRGSTSPCKTSVGVERPRSRLRQSYPWRRSLARVAAPVGLEASGGVNRLARSESANHAGYTARAYALCNAGSGSPSDSSDYPGDGIALVSHQAIEDGLPQWPHPLARGADGVDQHQAPNSSGVGRRREHRDPAAP